MRPDQNDVLDVDAVPEVSNYSELEGSVKVRGGQITVPYDLQAFPTIPNSKAR